MHPDFARIRSDVSEQGERERLASASDQAADPEDLTPVKGEGDVCVAPSQSQAVDLEERLA